MRRAAELALNSKRLPRSGPLAVTHLSARQPERLFSLRQYLRRGGSPANRHCISNPGSGIRNRPNSL